MMRLGNCPSSEAGILIKIGEVAPRKEGQQLCARSAVRRTKERKGARKA